MEYSVDRLKEIEHAALRAFPALEEEELNGWLLRYANGHSRRTNSVQPIEHSGDLTDHLAKAEAWYAARGIPITFRMTPASSPAELDALLESKRYFRQDPTSVQTLDLTGLGFVVDERIVFADDPTEPWFDSIMGSSRYMAGRRPTLERTLLMIEPPTTFAILWENGRPIATGLAVADGDLVGLYSISTQPDHRRRGLGRSMSETLLAWGQRMGASTAYLQVMHVNEPATKLYHRMGFSHVYDYWYRSPVDRPPMNG